MHSLVMIAPTMNSLVTLKNILFIQTPLIHFILMSVMKMYEIHTTKQVDA